MQERQDRLSGARNLPSDPKYGRNTDQADSYDYDRNLLTGTVDHDEL